MLPLGARVGIWLRLWALQGVWSYRRMQTVGWLRVALPLARRLDPERPGRAMKPLVVHFNTHPLLAPLIVGAALRRYWDGDGGAAAGEAARQILLRWMGTFGAIGDLFYWRGLLWNHAWLAATAYLSLGARGLATFALLAIVAELAARAWLFERGFAAPDTIAAVVEPVARPERRERLARGGLIGGAVVAGFICARAVTAYPVAPEALLLGILGAAVALPLAVATRYRGAVLVLPAALPLLLYLLE